MTCNKQLRAAKVKRADRITPEASVKVLEGFVVRYVLSKQKTWRVARGVTAIAANAAALRAQLKMTRRANTEAVKRDIETRLHLGTGAIDLLLDSVTRMSTEEAKEVVNQATRAGAALTSRDVRQDGPPADGVQAQRTELPPGAYFILLLKQGHGLVMKPLADTVVYQGRDGTRPLRIEEVTSATGYVVLGPKGISVGDYVINVERPPRAGDDKDSYRPTAMSNVTSERLTSGQFPLRLTVVRPTDVLSRGLPAVTQRLIGSAAEVTAATAVKAAEEAAAAAAAAAATAGRRKNSAQSTPAKSAQSTPAKGSRSSMPDSAAKEKAKQGQLKRGRGLQSEAEQQQPRKRHVSWADMPTA